MAQVDLHGLSGKDVNVAFRKLQAALTHGVKPIPMTLFNPGVPNVELDAYWRSGEGYWVTFEQDAAMGRHMCSYGVVDPAKESRQNLVCQINVQTADPWTRMGAFATDGHAIYYLHNGKLARRPTFAERYPGQRAVVHWEGHAPTNYFVVAKLGDRRTASQVGAYVKAIARFKGGGALEEEYRGAFEAGLAEAIHELEVRLGGADAGGVQSAGQSGPLQAGGATGPLDDVRAARARLDFLKLLDEKLRYDPYLLAAPVDRITDSVQADRRRRLQLSIGAAALSIGAGWLLSAISPSHVLDAIGHLYATLATVLTWLPH